MFQFGLHLLTAKNSISISSENVHKKLVGMNNSSANKALLQNTEQKELTPSYSPGSLGERPRYSLGAGDSTRTHRLSFSTHETTVSSFCGPPPQCFFSHPTLRSYLPSDLEHKCIPGIVQNRLVKRRGWVIFLKKKPPNPL